MAYDPQKEDAVSYLRVSASNQFQNGESILDQNNICINVAKTRNLNIIPDDKAFFDVFSGRKETRPSYEKLKEFIKKNRNVKYCIIRCIDRFTRSGTLVYETMKNELESMGVQLIDSHGVIQPSKNTLEHLNIEYPWSRVRPSEITELVMAQQGKSEVSQILTRTIGAEIALVRDGYHIGPPREGYLNGKTSEGKKKPIQIEDPKYAPFIKKMFKLRGLGIMTDKGIVAQINAEGYRSRIRNRWSKNKEKPIGKRGGHKLTVKHLQNIISNPIYCSVNTGVWLPAPIKTRYKGLVDIPTFNKANKGKKFIEENKDGSIIVHRDYGSHNLKRLKDNPLFPFKTVIRCPECGKPFMGSVSKGRSGAGFPAYHCSRGHKQYGVNKKEFEKNLTYFINNLKYKEGGFLKSFETTLINKYREKEKEIGEFSVKASTNVVDLETEKLQKIEAFTSTQNQIIRTALEKQIEEIQRQITEARGERNKLEIKENDIHAFVKYVKYLMEHPEEMLLNQKNFTILRALFGLVFDELPTYPEILNGTGKLSLPYKLSEEFYTSESFMAGDRGIEPRTADLEAAVIPLN